MKIIGMTSTTVLALLLASASVFAQQEQKSDKQDQSEQQQSKHEQAKPEQQHAQQQQKQDENKQAQQHAQQQQKQDQNKAQQQAQQQQKQNRTSRHSNRNSKSRNRTSRHISSEAINNLSAHKNSNGCNRLHGSSIDPRTGIPITAPGNSVVATTATAFPTIASVDTLVQNMSSASTDSPSWLWADIRASSMRAIGSVLLTHGRNIGGMTGMTTTTFM